MTKYAVIDTEGSGLFDFKKPADAEGQPRLAELAIIYMREDLQVEREYQAYVKPDGWTLSAEAAAANGLTVDLLTEKGVPVAEVLKVYSAAINDGYVIVAHNAQHDCKTMRAELRRAGMPDLFEITPNICTMRGLMGVVIKPGGKKGWPKISEAMAHFKIPQTGAHTALGDARAAAALLHKMVDIGVCPTPEVHFAKNPPAGKETPRTPAPVSQMDIDRANHTTPGTPAGSGRDDFEPV